MAGRSLTDILASSRFKDKIKPMPESTRTLVELLNKNKKAMNKTQRESLLAGLEKQLEYARTNTSPVRPTIGVSSQWYKVLDNGTFVSDVRVGVAKIESDVYAGASYEELATFYSTLIEAAKEGLLDEKLDDEKREREKRRAEKAEKASAKATPEAIKNKIADLEEDIELYEAKGDEAKVLDIKEQVA